MNCLLYKAKLVNDYPPKSITDIWLKEKIEEQLQKVLKNNNWIEGYPVYKQDKLYLYIEEGDTFIPIKEETLCKKVYENYYENDIFKYEKYFWVLKYEKSMNSYQLLRKDPKSDFVHYLPLTVINDAKYYGNTIDTPELI